MKQSTELYPGNAAEGEIEILMDPGRVAQAQEAARVNLQQQGLSHTWAQTGKIFEDDYLTIYRDPVCFPGGKLGTYLRVEWAQRHGNGVVMLPRLKDRFVLIRHFRHATRSWHWELPRGFGEPNTSSEESAARELSEEIGAKPTSLKHLGAFNPDSGMTGHKVDAYSADIDTVKGLERSEGIGGSKLVTAKELQSMIADGQITDGMTLCAVGLASAMGHLDNKSLLKRLFF